MQLPDPGRISLDKVLPVIYKNEKVELDVLRLDKIHPVISGNKWFKLKFHLEKFRTGNYKGILTFGGAWSNHIVATACTCHIKNITSVGIIRGEQPAQLSPALEAALKYKMRLKFIAREFYMQKKNEAFLELVQTEFPGYYIIPEGGAGEPGEKGAGEIINFIPKNTYTHIACAVGTGTMFNGLGNVLSKRHQLLGVIVLKGWRKSVEINNAKLLNGYHFGGYAKHTHELITFMNDFYRTTNIPTDFVYTGKLAFAIVDMIRKRHFADGSNILIIHSGGLQGNSSLQKGSLIF